MDYDDLFSIFIVNTFYVLNSNDKVCFVFFTGIKRSNIASLEGNCYLFLVYSCLFRILFTRVSNSISVNHTSSDN